MKIFSKTIYISILFLALFFPAVTFSADISVATPATAEVGKSFEALIKMNSDGVLINSASMVLDYDEKLLSFSGYKSEGSVIGIWVESPNEKNGLIYMSGIIPGGVAGLYDPRANGQQGLGATTLVRLVFTAKKEGNANFSFTETQILKHDGRGTELSHTNTGGQISLKIVGENNKIEDSVATDNEKPEPFEITFIDSSPASGTPSMIIFRATDVGSGIKKYKMSIGGSLWTDVKSPWPISKGVFPKNITIRAYDFSDNYEDASIRLDGLVSPIILSIILIMLGLLCFAGYKMIKYNRNET